MGLAISLISDVKEKVILQIFKKSLHQCDFVRPSCGNLTFVVVSNVPAFNLATLFSLVAALFCFLSVCFFVCFLFFCFLFLFFAFYACFVSFFLFYRF